jgi:hypothetical protein
MLLKRAQIGDIPSSDRWNIGAAWELEKQRIEEFVDDEANIAYGRFPDNVESAKALAPDVWHKIVNAYPIDSQLDANLLSDVKLGLPEKLAGSKALLVTVRVLLALAMGVEVAIFVAMWAVGEASWPVIVQGAVLAIGSWSLGWGLYNLTIALDQREKTRGSRVLTLSALIFGALSIAVVTAMRAQLTQEQSFAIVAITLTLALLIALMETLSESMGHRYGIHHRDMFRAQQQYANSQHNAHHKTGGQKWIDQFKYAVDRRATTTPKILHGSEAEKVGEPR